MNNLPENTHLGRLRVREVYHYFDGPKLFCCENASGQKFLAFWLGDEEEEADRWLYLPVSETRFQDVRSGKVGLQQACLNPEDGFVWIVEIPEEPGGQPMVRAQDPARLSPDLLPAGDAILSVVGQAGG